MGNFLWRVRYTPAIHRHGSNKYACAHMCVKLRNQFRMHACVDWIRKFCNLTFQMKPSTYSLEVFMVGHSEPDGISSKSDSTMSNGFSASISSGLQSSIVEISTFLCLVLAHGSPSSTVLPKSSHIFIRMQHSSLVILCFEMLFLQHAFSPSPLFRC